MEVSFSRALDATSMLTAYRHVYNPTNSVWARENETHYLKPASLEYERQAGKVSL